MLQEQMQNYVLKDELENRLGAMIDAKIEANNVIVKEQFLPDFFKISNLIGPDPETSFKSVQAWIVESWKTIHAIAKSNRELDTYTKWSQLQSELRLQEALKKATFDVYTDISKEIDKVKQESKEALEQESQKREMASKQIQTKFDDELQKVKLQQEAQAKTIEKQAGDLASQSKILLVLQNATD